MRTALLAVTAILASCAAVYFHFGALGARAEQDRLSDQMVQLRSQWQQATATALTATERVEGLAAQVKRLEADLLSAHQSRRDVDSFLEKTETALRAERARHNQEIWAAKKFMPEGVRQALLAINQCLRLDGHDGLRFMKAKSLEDFALHDVQMLDHDPSSLQSSLFMVDKLRFELDRATAKLTILLEGGFHRSPAGRRELPAAGEPLVLTGVDGPQWEERLPYLVRAQGEYPRTTPPAHKPVMAAIERAGWRTRLNRLFALSTTTTRYRIEKFRNLRGAQFEDILLLGLERTVVLTMSVEAEQMAIHVDDREQAVEVRVTGGILRKIGGETSIPRSGYRIRLVGVSPAKAIEVMQGMVVRR